MNTQFKKGHLNKTLVLVFALVAFGFAGNLLADSPNAKCKTALAFNFDPTTIVPEGTDVTVTEEITTTDAGAGQQACGLSIGSYVNDGSAKITKVTLGVGGPGVPCASIGKKLCSVGTSAAPDNSCGNGADCITNPLGGGVCTPVNAVAGPNVIASENPTDGQVDALVDTTGLAGSVMGFVGSYLGQGNFDSPPDICSDLTVTEAEEECTGVTISVDLASGPGFPVSPGGPYNWSFEVLVHACEDLYGVSAQGGTNGWALLANNRNPNLSLHPSTGAGTAVVRKANKKADVILWTIGDMVAGQEETLVVDVSGSIKGAPDCQERFLSGPWSALFSNDGFLFEKTDYTGRVSVHVDSNGVPGDCI